VAVIGGEEMGKHGIERALRPGPFTL